jgi:DNA polymerase-3 subunit gamma/tau
MTYQVLARKWRPHGFDSVVGQEHVVTALRNALREDRIAAAYLFSGIRGVGKTSVARIFAKALNCERGQAEGPCNECGTCKSVDDGSNLDILQIDAATYSKVEQVRELTENLKYKPVGLRKKVVVLDEVHRLSRQAFDALLKIIEEPPEHLVFVFATTELEAVPATILSRCQEFNFRRVPRQALVEHLTQVAAAEKITAGDKALRLIARASEGSVRDAVALLDQLATYGSGVIADDEAGRILGGVDAALHHRVLSAIVAGDRPTIVKAVAEVEEQGWDPRHVYGEFLAYCRDVLHLALGAGVDEVELPDDDARTARQLALDAGYENLLRLLQQLLAGEEAMRRSRAGRLALEIAWLRGAELPRLTAIEELLTGSPPPARQPPAEPKPAKAADDGSAPASTATRRRPRALPDQAAVVASTAAGPVADPAPEPAAEPSPPTEAAPEPASAAGGVEGFLALVRQRRQVIAAHLADVAGIEFADGCLTLRTAPGDSWLESALRRDANRLAFEECLTETFGAGNRWQILAAQEEAPVATAAPPAAEAVAPPPDPLLHHPTVQAALDVFGGTVEALDDAN